MQEGKDNKKMYCIKCGGTEWKDMPVITLNVDGKLVTSEVPEGIPNPCRCLNCGSVRSKEQFESWLEDLYTKHSLCFNYHDLRYIRIDLGMTHEDIAKLLGVDLEVAEKKLGMLFNLQH